MEQDLVVRRAELSDAEAIARIYNEAILTTTATFDTESKTVDDRIRWLEAHDDRHPVFVAELNGEVVGWAALNTWSERAAYRDTAETSFYVLEAFRGRGVGRMLKATLVEQARSLGFHTLIARVAQESDVSLHLNTSFGFQRIGTMREVGFKFGRRLDVHLLQLMLDEPADPAGGDAVESSPATVDSLASEFLKGAITVFRANKRLADAAVAQLPDDKLHVALSADVNSIAVIMKHVAGNLLSRWTHFLTTDGDKPWRNRDEEFVDTFENRAQVLEYWEKGWRRLFETLQSLQPGDLARTVTIRGEPHSVPTAIHRSQAHCGYHIGQIVFVARVLAGDQWKTITIPRGQSETYNRKFLGSGEAYGEPPTQ